MKLVAALVLLATACGGATSAPPDAGADAPTGNLYCDVPDGDAGATFGAQCGGGGIYWTWFDAENYPHPCSDPPPLGAACEVDRPGQQAVERGVVAD